MAGDSSLGPEVAARVVAEIDRRSLTTAEAAELFGCSGQSVRNWRKGSRIRSGFVAIAAELWSIPFDELVYGEGEALNRSRREQNRDARQKTLEMISEGLDDATVRVLAGYTPETIRLALVVSLQRFAAGKTAKQGESRHV